MHAGAVRVSEDKVTARSRSSCRVLAVFNVVMTYSNKQFFMLHRSQHFKQSIMFMHESRLKGEGCLVHW